jgi:hypothetical protein
VVTKVLLAEAGQSVTVEGQAVIVAVLVEKMVEVVDPSGARWPVCSGPLLPEPDWLVVVGCGSSVRGQTVVETTRVSVVTKVLLADAGQSVTVEGQAVIVAVLVERIVEVVDLSGARPVCSVPPSPEPGWLVVVGCCSSVRGQTVVETTRVSVVTKVVMADAGQSTTDDGQAVIVAVLVVNIVDVVDLPVSD